MKKYIGDSVYATRQPGNSILLTIESDIAEISWIALKKECIDELYRLALEWREEP